MWLMVSFVTAVIGGIVASAKGRNVVAWVVLGFLFGLIGVLIVCCLPNVKEQRADRDRIELEHRRLREQLRQERMKNESFRQYAAGRLDAHDQVLGVETRTAQALPPPGESSPEQALAAMAGGELDPIPLVEAPPQARSPQPMAAAATGWYYELNGAQQGPVSGREIKALLDSARIHAATLVCTKGMTDWVPLSEVPWFRRQVAS
ncbi:MAG: GYF domain-containing protein [Planctomycetota bacterium]|nr:GYF domain-containing protein [Planctomycetota bacterium]